MIRLPPSSTLFPYTTLFRSLPSGVPYLVMEWLEGEDLARTLARGRLRVADSVRIARGVAEALAAAHDPEDRKSTRLNSSHLGISYAVFCLKKKKNTKQVKTA